MILIRCAAGAREGMGHLVRVRALADQLAADGIGCALVGPPEALRVPADAGRFAAWICRPGWEGAEAEAAFHLALARQFGARVILLDDYRSDAAHQGLLRDAGLFLLQQYDASRPRRFAAHVAINASPSERREDLTLLAPGIETLLGPAYAILRPDFARRRPDGPRCAARRALISYGGGDDRGALLRALEALRTGLPAGMTAVAVAGAHNPRAAEAAAWVAAEPSGRFALEIDPPDMAGVIAGCDVAVLGGGTTTFEAAFCGLPMALTPIADNQLAQGQGWAALGAALWLGPFESAPPERLAGAVAALAADPARLRAMSAAALAAVDGDGALRLRARIRKAAG